MGSIWQIESERLLGWELHSSASKSFLDPLSVQKNKQTVITEAWICRERPKEAIQASNRGRVVLTEELFFEGIRLS